MSQSLKPFWSKIGYFTPLQWRHNERDCLLNRLFRRRSKKTSKLRVTGLCAGNSPGTGEFPAQMASYAENVSIWWRHHAIIDTIGLMIWVNQRCWREHGEAYMSGWKVTVPESVTIGLL